MTNRRAKLEALLQAEPHDPFLRYSLAMEMQKEGDFAASLEAFAALQQEAPPYVPAFFMAGQLLVRLDRIPEARAVLRSGIETARLVGDQHAAGEMSELLATLGRSGD